MQTMQTVGYVVYMALQIYIWALLGRMLIS